MCDDSILLPYGTLAVMLFLIITGAIVVVACFARFIFAPVSAIASVFILGELGGFPIQFIKLVLGLLIEILLIIAPNCHSHHF